MRRPFPFHNLPFRKICLYLHHINAFAMSIHKKIFSLTLLAYAAAMLNGAYADTAAARDSVYRYSAEANATFSEGHHSPFWLSANKYGLSSIKRNNGYLRAGIFRDIDYTPRWDWSFGADFAVGYDLTSTFVIQQLYGSIRWRCLQLTIGSREHTEGFVDERLSSGDLLLSNNARPIPQARLEMPHFQTVPYTKGWLAVKGYFSFGIMTDGRWQRHWVNMEIPRSKRSEHRLYHSKGVFIRIGRENKYPLSFEGGLEMNAQFGGTVYCRSIYPPYGISVIKMPHGIKDIAKVIVPTSGDSKGDINLMGETTNVTGNHTGQWDAALKWHDAERDFTARLYYQHFFEDHSMMFFDHIWKDMLLGVEVKLPKNRFVSKFVYEYLNTRDQSGSVYWDHTPQIPEQVSGRDDYYNHYLNMLWSHWGMGMGNPLLISPIYNADRMLIFCHNRIKGHHIGMEGNPTPQLSYRMLLSLYRSWGSYLIPTADIAHSFNALWEVNYHPARLNGWSGTLSLGLDAGGLLGPSFGATISIKKTGWL